MKKTFNKAIAQGTLVVFCFFSSIALAESSSSSSASPSTPASSSTPSTTIPTTSLDTGSSSGSGSGSGDSSGTTLQMQQGSFTPPTSPTKMDMSQKSKAAAVAAQAAAASQQVNCLQMQANAAEIEDPKEKATAQMLAGMQCAQAQQSQQNAKDNEEQSKKTSEEMPKPGTYTPSSVVLTGDNNNESQVPSASIPAYKSSAIEDPVISPIDSNPILQTGGSSSVANDSSDSVNVPTDPPAANLPVMPGPSLVNTDDAKNQSAAPASGSPMLVGSASSANSASSNNANKTEEIRSEIDEIERNARTVAGQSGEGSSGGGESSGQGKGSGMLEALMAQLNPESGAAAAAVGSSLIESQLASSAKGGNRPAGANIFECATFHYHLAAKQSRLRATVA